MKTLNTYATHFCGVGGACYGIESAGLKCNLAIDFNPVAVEYREKNLGHKALLMDIAKYKPDPSHAADILWTSPSCQSFSTSAREQVIRNFMKHKKEICGEDIRNNLFLSSVNYCMHFQPKFFVLENVRGMLTHSDDGENTIHKIMAMFKDAGYYCEWNIFNSMNWNLPQKRYRVIIVGSLGGKHKGLIPVEPYPNPTCKFKDIREYHLTHLHWGAETYRTALEKVKRTGIDIQVIMDDDVLPTLTCGFGGGATRKKTAIVDTTDKGIPFLRHPSVREGARAQGFPDSWVWPDQKVDAWTLIGNAVSSPIAKTIIEHLQALESGDRPPCKTELDRRLVSKEIREYGNDIPPKMTW